MPTPSATGTAPILILGGGPSGVAAAITLARAGRAVTLLERETAPRHKVCGEFLSVEALTLLDRLGLDPATHAAPSIHTVRLASRDTLTAALLPFPARSLTRRCLDSLLLQAADAAGVSVLRGAGVQSLHRARGLWHATLASKEILTAPQAILASGKHDLRGFPRPSGPQGDLVALKMYFHLAGSPERELEGAVELLLHPHGYTGLQLVEDGSANLCALVRRRHLTELRGWPGLLAELQATNPHAARRLHGATPLLDKPLAISAIPYGFVRRQAPGPGLYAIGDQAAVIPSFTGDGMSLALYTGIRAAEDLLTGISAEHFQGNLARELRPQIARATVLSRSLIHPVLRPWLTTLAALWPGSLRRVASLTRIPAAMAQPPL